MSISVKDKQAAVLLSMAACCIEAVYIEERPQSFRHNKMGSALTALRTATDDYAGPDFQGDDMVKAEIIYDKMKKHVDKLFAPPKVKRVPGERVRGRDGRFVRG